jgi:hypothetical protein
MAPCAQTQFATAPCVRTQLARRLRSDAVATAYAFRTRSVRAFAFWTQLARQLRSDATATAYAFRTRSVRASAHLDAARVIRTKNVMANSDRTTPVTAPRVQTQLSRRLHSDAAVTALKIAAKP